MMNFAKTLISLAIGIPLTCSCLGSEMGSERTVTYQMVEVKRDQQRSWLVKHPAHYHGVYTMEEGAGSGVIHLWAYLHDGKTEFRFSGCVIISEDVLSKPNMKVFENLKLFPGEGRIANDEITIMPLEIRPNLSGKWIQGVVYDGVFFRKRLLPCR